LGLLSFESSTLSRLLEFAIARGEDRLGAAFEFVARQNHWLRLRFSGVKDAELIGPRVEVTATGI